jgi:hypothetical protein
MFNPTFNDISTLPWRLVLLVRNRSTRRKPLTHLKSRQTLSHNVAPRLEWNSISPLRIVRVLGKNGRMWCQNLIHWLKACTISGLSIFVKGYFPYHWSIVFWNCSDSVIFLVFIFVDNIYIAVKLQYFRGRYLSNTKLRLYYILKASWHNTFDLKDSNS